MMNLHDFRDDGGIPAWRANQATWPSDREVVRFRHLNRNRLKIRICLAEVALFIHGGLVSPVAN